MTAADVLAGLQRPLPEISTAFLYDDHGSVLFERITRQPEYYQTRTEIALMELRGAEIVDHVQPRRLAELGSGAARKIGQLLRHMPAGECTLFELNSSFLEGSVQRLQQAYPQHQVKGVVGNFLEDLSPLAPGGGPRIVLFLAGTFGNLKPAAVRPFMGQVRSILAPEDRFLVGVDLVKDPARLHAAYNDAAGITAAFNLNSLQVLNRRYGAGFELDAWSHRAFYDPEAQWIEMRVVARRAQRIRLGGEELRFAPGDEIRTEVSCKYTRASLGERIGGDMRVDRWYADPQELFALALVRP